MKASSPWITYRTRFLVKAKQLSSSLTFTDALGRLHSGRKGDYLVESSDGVLRIAPRQIFEDIYVPLLADATSEQPTIPPYQEISPQFRARKRETADNLSLTRKSPQPERTRRTFIPGINSL